MPPLVELVELIAVLPTMRSANCSICWSDCCASASGSPANLRSSAASSRYRSLVASSEMTASSSNFAAPATYRVGEIGSQDGRCALPFCLRGEKRNVRQLRTPRETWHLVTFGAHSPQVFRRETVIGAK